MTGHVLIGGVVTMKITGRPVTVRLPAGSARPGPEKWVARWVLYVSPKTYLPVLMYGSTKVSGGQAHPSFSTFVTDVRWLPPTPANIAKALVQIPQGFHQVSVRLTR